MGTEGRQALLAALAAHAGDAAREVQVAAVEPHGLGGARAGGVHQLEDGAVASTGRGADVGRLEQGLDLAELEAAGQEPRRAALAQARGRVLLDQALALQEAEQRAHARELALHARGGQLAVLEGDQVAPQGAPVDLARIRDAGVLEEAGQLRQVAAVGAQGVLRCAARGGQVAQEAVDVFVQAHGRSMRRACPADHAGLRDGGGGPSRARPSRASRPARSSARPRAASASPSRGSRARGS